jgi:phage terminase small subunit
MAAEKPVPLFAYRPTVPPEPPTELGLAGSKLWRDILKEWVISDAAPLAVLEQACEAYDRAESLRREIQVSGELIETAGGGTKANPLLAIELQARSLTARLLGRLDLLDTGPKRGPGRPPKVGGW